MAKGKIELKISEGDAEVAYLYLSRHPERSTPRVVHKTLALHELVENYRGASVYLDFDEQGYLIGIEILE